MDRRLTHLALLLGILSGTLALEAPAADLVTVETGADAVVVQPAPSDARLALTVTGPDGFVFARRFSTDRATYLPATDLADGLYRWQLRAEVAPARAGSSGPVLQRGPDELAGRVASHDTAEAARSQSGYFRVQDGAFVVPSTEETGLQTAASEGVETPISALGAGTSSGVTHLAEADQVILDDLAVLGRECIGFSCSTSEDFGADDLRFRDSNIRVHFADSSASGFPTTDWRITVNDSTSGGAGRFSIDDVDAGRTPFTIEAGAPSNALYVDSSGRIGLGTSAPLEEIHALQGDSPGLRLEQDASLGFTPQAWEIVGNEANFIIEDVTHGSKYPFRIRPDAPTDTLHLAADGDVALGTGTIPGDVRFLVQANTSANFGGLRVQNSGSGNIQTQFAGSGWEWRQTFRSGDMIFDSQEDGANELVLTTGGVLTVTSVVQTSDRNLKENVESIDTGDILDRLAAIPIQRWNFTEDRGDTPHLGPMAQDFYAAFGLGSDDRHIAATDADGVALAAIQALYQRLLAKEAALDELRSRLEAHDRALQELLGARGADEP